MEQRIKLIWDFRGPDALKIAEHHVIHLDEYKAVHDLEANETGVEQKSELYAIAYFMVSKAQMLAVRDALKPHRGEFCD